MNLIAIFTFFCFSQINGNDISKTALMDAEYFFNEKIENFYDRFSSDLKKQLPLKTLINVRNSLLQQFGKVVKINKTITLEEKEDYNAAIVEVVLYDKKVSLRIVYDSNLKIAGFFIQ